MSIKHMSPIDLMRKYFYGDVAQEANAIDMRLVSLGLSAKETLEIHGELDKVLEAHCPKTDDDNAVYS